MMCAGYGRRGLGKYEAAFRANEIDETVLPNLTAQDLKETRCVAKRDFVAWSLACAGPWLRGLWGADQNCPRPGRIDLVPSG